MADHSPTERADTWEPFPCRCASGNHTCGLTEYAVQVLREADYTVVSIEDQADGWVVLNPEQAKEAERAGLLARQFEKSRAGGSAQ